MQESLRAPSLVLSYFLFDINDIVDTSLFIIVDNPIDPARNQQRSGNDSPMGN